MKLARAVLRSFHHGIYRQSLRLNVARSLSTDVTSGHAAGGGRNSGSSESADDFERRIFGDYTGSGSRSDSFFQKLDRVQQARWSYGANRGNGPDRMDDIDDGLDTLSDGMDGKLKEAAEFFEVDHEECDNEDYSFRPDINFSGSYDVTDLDLRKPGVWLPEEPDEMDVTTEEVLKKADFRNVRFLAQFITEAGIIIKRSQSGISAKAQRKVAREIKTARAFGLMPFTTMGTKSFAFGKTMENLEADYQHQTRYEDPDDDEDLQAVDIP